MNLNPLFIETEDKKFLSLRQKFASELRKESFSVELFAEICHWKSQRNSKHPFKNSSKKITDVMSSIFKYGHVQSMAIEQLCTLDGVRTPTASVFLTLYCPEKYGVIDYHAWQSLHNRGLLHYNESGKGLKPDDYRNYLNRIRSLANEYNVTPRIIDISLMADNQRRNPKIKHNCWFST